MARCNNTLEQVVPTRYSSKLVPMTCGSTGYYGDPVYCDECTAKFNKRGYMPYECPHGMDMRPEGAMCHYCEFGEPLDGDEEEAPSKYIQPTQDPNEYGSMRVVQTVTGPEWQHDEQ